MRGAGRPAAAAAAWTFGTMWLSMAAGGAIHSTVPSASSPATRSNLGPKADTSTGTGCAGVDRPAGGVRGPVTPVEVDGVAAQHSSEDAHVLLGAAPRMVVGEAVHAPDHGLVRGPDAESEAGASHGVDDRGRAVGLEQRMARVGLQHRGTELDARGLPSGDGDRHERDRPVTTLAYHSDVKPSASACFACRTTLSTVAAPPVRPIRICPSPTLCCTIV